MGCEELKPTQSAGKRLRMVLREYEGHTLKRSRSTSGQKGRYKIKVTICVTHVFLAILDVDIDRDGYSFLYHVWNSQILSVNKMALYPVRYRWHGTIKTPKKRLYLFEN